MPRILCTLVFTHFQNGCFNHNSELTKLRRMPVSSRKRVFTPFHDRVMQNQLQKLPDGVIYQRSEVMSRDSRLTLLASDTSLRFSTTTGVCVRRRRLWAFSISEAGRSLKDDAANLVTDFLAASCDPWLGMRLSI